jgi:hypothetical protein
MALRKKFRVWKRNSIIIWKYWIKRKHWNTANENLNDPIKNSFENLIENGRSWK